MGQRVAFITDHYRVVLDTVSCILPSAWYPGLQTGSLQPGGGWTAQGCSIAGTPLGELRLVGWDLWYLH